MRERMSPRLSAARLQLAADGRGLGPRDQEEQRTQRASFVATYIVLGSNARLNKHHVKRLGTPLRGQTRVSQRRLRCLSPAPSEMHSARRQTGVNFLSPKKLTAKPHGGTNK